MTDSKPVAVERGEAPPSAPTEDVCRDIREIATDIGWDGGYPNSAEVLRTAADQIASILAAKAAAEQELDAAERRYLRMWEDRDECIGKARRAEQAERERDKFERLFEMESHAYRKSEARAEQVEATLQAVSRLVEQWRETAELAEKLLDFNQRHNNIPDDANIQAYRSCADELSTLLAERAAQKPSESPQ